MKIFSKTHFITSFSSRNKPAFSVDLGETFVVETHDCYGGVITSSEQLRTELNIDYINPATGPIYINDLHKGDVLCVEIVNIHLDEQGVMVLYPGMGPLGNQVPFTDTKILPVMDGKIRFNPSIDIPIKPMIGVIGVAPDVGEVICESPGDHGGNMDTKFITKGNKVFFPVFHDGGLLALGDLHAAMGDGELNGSGIEVGGKVTLRVTKTSTPAIKMPIVETEEFYLFISSDQTLEKAAEKGMQAVVHLFQESLSLSFNDAYRLLSAVCDLQISQIVNPLVTLRVAVPKYLLKTTCAN